MTSRYKPAAGIGPVTGARGHCSFHEPLGAAPKRRWRLLGLVVATLLLGACGSESDGPKLVDSAAGSAGCEELGNCEPSSTPTPPSQTPQFSPVPAISDQLVELGYARDVADLISSATLKVEPAGTSAQRLLQTYPNGSTREVVVSFVPGQSIVPTEVEVARAQAVGVQVYRTKFARSIDPDTVRATYEFFVPYQTMSPEQRAVMDPSAPVLKSRVGPVRKSEVPGVEVSGATLVVVETIKSGADAAIGSFLDAAAELGLPGGGVVNSAYKIASLLNTIGQAAQLGQEVSGGLDTLWALEYCAANPTNFLAGSDPDYSGRTTEKVRSATGEFKEVNSFRYLNQMLAVTAGVPGIQALPVLLAGGIAWADQTLKDFLGNTVMREAKEGVIPCDFGFTVQFEFTYKNEYEFCDDICYRYEKELTAKFEGSLEAIPVGSVYRTGTVGTSTLSLKDNSTLTDTRALLPPYLISQVKTVVDVAEVSAGGGPMPVSGDGGGVDPILAAMKNGKRMISVDLSKSSFVSGEEAASSSVRWVRMESRYVNSTPTTVRQPITGWVDMKVECKFEDVDSTLGGAYLGSVVNSTFAEVRLGSPQNLCKIDLVPMIPSRR